MTKTETSSKSMNEVTEQQVKRKDGGWDRILVCTCGALCLRKIDRRRFKVRHPAVCNERRRVAQELSGGTRAVDDEEGRMVWNKDR